MVICSGKKPHLPMQETLDLGSIPWSGRDPGGGNGQPTPAFLENPMDRGSWWPTVHRVAQSCTRLKRQPSTAYFYKSQIARRQVQSCIIMITS